MTTTLSFTAKRSRNRAYLAALLALLFVVAGQCSIAMAGTSFPVPDTGSSQEAIGHCQSMEASHQSSDGAEHDNCMDVHCPQTSSALQAQSSKLSKQKLEPVDISLAQIERSPPVRSGPCDRILPQQSIDSSFPPLYYSLCVLRL